jgi:hypothetical protein
VNAVLRNIEGVQNQYRRDGFPIMKLFESGTNSMLRDIEAEVRYTRSLIGKDALDAQVMQAMARVPRHEFVPAALQLTLLTRVTNGAHDVGLTAAFINGVTHGLAVDGQRLKRLDFLSFFLIARITWPNRRW